MCGFELLRDGESVELEDNRSEEIILEKSNEVVHNFQIRINAKDNIVEDILGDIKIKIYSEQIL